MKLNRLNFSSAVAIKAQVTTPFYVMKTDDNRFFVQTDGLGYLDRGAANNLCAKLNNYVDEHSTENA